MVDGSKKADGQHPCPKNVLPGVILLVSASLCAGLRVSLPHINSFLGSAHGAGPASPASPASQEPRRFDALPRPLLFRAEAPQTDVPFELGF